MITEHHYKKLTWIDVENPTQEDIDLLIKNHDIHPRCARELTIPTERAKVDMYEPNSLFIVLHYPDHPAHNTHVQELEIDYVIKEHALITVHYKPIDTFIEFGKSLQVEDALDRTTIGTTGGHLFFYINNLLYQGLSEELEMIRYDIKKIESQIFSGSELKMVEEISSLQRKLLDFKQATRFHGSILKSFENNSRKFFGKSFNVDEENIHHEYIKVQSTLENERELLKELRDTNDSLLTSKNNDITKRFTMMAFFTFPLSLVAVVLLAPESPLVFHGRAGFWMVVGILVALFLLMYGYFKHKKWL